MLTNGTRNVETHKQIEVMLPSATGGLYSVSGSSGIGHSFAFACVVVLCAVNLRHLCFSPEA